MVGDVEEVGPAFLTLWTAAAALGNQGHGLRGPGVKQNLIDNLLWYVFNKG